MPLFNMADRTRIDNTLSTTLRRKKKAYVNGKASNGHIYLDGGAVPPSTSLAPPPTNPHHQELSTTSDILQIWAPTLMLIFGGCCSNVYTLESLIHTSHSSGPLITAFQFLLTSLFTLPGHLSYSRSWRNLFLRPRSIPLKKWLIYTAFFLSVNVLNNTAFKYRISVPLHIILRSAGPVATMLIGRVVGQRTYPPQKICAVLLLFVGVVCAAISDAWSKEKAQTHGREADFTTLTLSEPISWRASAVWSQVPGFALLTLALLLSALMGVYADGLYARHGRSKSITSETLFYSHTLSLPFFLLQSRSLITEIGSLASSSPSLGTYVRHSPASRFGITARTSLFRYVAAVPMSVPLLFANALTQYICISGVNRLSAKSSSLTVSIVLNIRKLASLILSIWLFGNQLPFGVMVGAAIVFVGGALYALPTTTKPTDDNHQVNNDGKKLKNRKAL